MLIRAATPDDVPIIRALASQSPDAAQWSEQHYDAIANAGSGRVVLVAEAQGELLGFLVAREIAGEWELENIAVAAHARRRGVASALMAKLVETGLQRGSLAIHLEVRGQNRAARALYERLGFVQSGLRRGYYDCPRDDAILYTREFRAATPENN